MTVGVVSHFYDEKITEITQKGDIIRTRNCALAVIAVRLRLRRFVSPGWSVITIVVSSIWISYYSMVISNTCYIENIVFIYMYIFFLSNGRTTAFLLYGLNEIHVVWRSTRHRGRSTVISFAISLISKWLSLSCWNQCLSAVTSGRTSIVMVNCIFVACGKRTAG
jgi:hypothetical protein